MDGAVARISLAALKHNLDVVRQRAPGSRIMAVVKANAYGHGVINCLPALEEADALAVARTDEGIFLRDRGVEKPIVVLEGFFSIDQLRRSQAADLQPVIHASYQHQLAKDAGVALQVWLKVDTGMHRLGLEERTYREIVADPGSVRIVGVMSHLAGADDRSDPATPDQIARFQHLRTAGVPACLANSAGILGWGDSHFDWVRPGIMLYGISPFKEPHPCAALRPVMTLTAPVIAVNRVRSGESVGYGGHWRCRRDSVIGVVAIGYGDGYRREAGDGVPVQINGHRYPLVGRVSMDMITVDLTDGPMVDPGAVAMLWGPGLPVEKVAACHGTIPYTLTSGLTRRVRFIFEQRAPGRCKPSTLEAGRGAWDS